MNKEVLERQKSEVGILLFVYFKLILGGSLGGCCSGDGWIQRDMEVNGTRVHDVKFTPKINKELYLKTEREGDE